MKIIKLKINNFLLPLFLLAFLCTPLPAVYAQNEPPTEEAATAPEVQNQTPPATPETPQKKEVKPKKQVPKAKPAENQPPTQTAEENPQPAPTAEQPEKTEQTDSQEQKSKPQKNESPANKENKAEPPKEPDLPEVSDKEMQENSSPGLELPTKDGKNIIKTVISWLLMGIGLLIIIKVIVSNFQIPKNYEPHIKNKHGFKSGKKKSKYSLKYK